MAPTRAGDIDPAILPYLLGKGFSGEELDNIMNKQSGFLGMAGVTQVAWGWQAGLQHPVCNNRRPAGRMGARRVAWPSAALVAAGRHFWVTCVLRPPPPSFQLTGSIDVRTVEECALKGDEECMLALAVSLLSSSSRAGKLAEAASCSLKLRACWRPARFRLCACAGAEGAYALQM